MIIDGRTNGVTPDSSYDVLIVGGGPAGITLATELAETGARIALLESGGDEFDAATQELNDGAVEGNDGELDLTAVRLRMFGGTSNHWSGRCLPLDPVDFSRGPGNGLSGWPIGREELDPFYARAHEYCDLGPYEYDLEKLVSLPEESFLFPHHPDIETGIVRQSPPTRFGDKYKDSLAAATNVHVWFWANATHLDFGPDGALDGVETSTLTGVFRRFTARRIVLASGAIETARLLMVSNLRAGTAYGDAGGLLGRCYMDHPSGRAAFLHFLEPLGEKVYWADLKNRQPDGVPLHFILRLSDRFIAEKNLANAQFYVTPVAESDAAQIRRRDAHHSFRALKRIVKWTIGRDVGARFSLAKEYCDFITDADSFLAEQITPAPTEGVSRALLKYEAEQKPQRSSYVELGDTVDQLGQPLPVLRWAPTQDDIDSIIESVTWIGRFCGETGLARLQIEDNADEPYWGMTTAAHQLGVTRMAKRETSGVVDPQCRVFGTRSLYIAGGGVFPTSGRANPTLTIVALSIRLADHLKGALRV